MAGPESVDWGIDDEHIIAEGCVAYSQLVFDGHPQYPPLDFLKIYVKPELISHQEDFRSVALFVMGQEVSDTFGLYAATAHRTQSGFEITRTAMSMHGSPIDWQGELRLYRTPREILLLRQKARQAVLRAPRISDPNTAVQLVDRGFENAGLMKSESVKDSSATAPLASVVSLSTWRWKRATDHR